MTMITSNGKQPREMTLKELKEEKRIQRWLARQFRRRADQEMWYFRMQSKLVKELHEKLLTKKITPEEYKHEKAMIERKNRATKDREKNANLCKLYEDTIRLFIEEIEDCKQFHKKPSKKKRVRGYSPYKKDMHQYRKKVVTKEEKRAERARALQKQYDVLLNRNGVVLQWDKRKLMLIARDRGYFTEIAVAYAIEKELEMPKQTIKRMLQEGKFTWGQVLVIGAMFEMTPKEFCDTFLCGYFLEQGGDWRASDKHLDKNGLLAKPTTSLWKSQLEKGTTAEE